MSSFLIHWNKEKIKTDNKFYKNLSGSICPEFSFPFYLFIFNLMFRHVKKMFLREKFAKYSPFQLGKLQKQNLVFPFSLFEHSCPHQLLEH